MVTVDDTGYRARGIPGWGIIIQGKSPEEAPYGEAWALGNIVRLKEPYRPCLGADLHGNVPRTEYQYGVIVEHIGGDFRGDPRVSLHLYSADGRIFMEPNHIPEYVDFCVSELDLWKRVEELGYQPIMPLEEEQKEGAG